MSTATFPRQEDLFRVLYCSRNCAGDADIDQSLAMKDILRSARMNNSAANITGALLFSAGYFAQVLEGPRAAIEHTFERIQRDQRHNDVTVLECSGIESRDFPDWSMAQVAPVNPNQAKAAGTTLNAAIADPRHAGSDVLVLMRTLVIEAE